MLWAYKKLFLGRANKHRYVKTIFKCSCDFQRRLKTPHQYQNPFP